MGTTALARPRRRGAACGLALALAFASCAGGSPPPRLVLLLTVDTLRADRLGAYGSDRGLTPHLDALARRGVVFTAAYAPAPFTLPSVAALLTGRHPESLGIWTNESGVPSSVPTLAGELSRRGWRTAAVVSNFVLRRSAGLADGFDRYDDTLREREVVRHWPERTAAATTDAALAMLDGCAETRCFLWVHYQDPHGPYTPPAEDRRRFLARERTAPDGARELPALSTFDGIGGIPAYQVIDDHRDVAFYRAGYDAEVFAVDREIGRLLDELAARGLTGQALVVFAADHGESLGEGDLWFAHGEQLSEALMRVPLLLAGPGIRAGRRDDVVSLLDVAPTLRARLGLVPPDPPLPGRDLLADGASGQASAPVLVNLGHARVQRYGLVDGGFKLVLSEHGGLWDERLTRRGRDEPDLAAAAPQVAAAMREKLQAAQRELARGLPETRQALSPEDRERLRELGYAADP